MASMLLAVTGSYTHCLGLSAVFVPVSGVRRVVVSVSVFPDVIFYEMQF
jgi:hypothetical protein